MYKRTYMSPEGKIQAVEEYLGGTESLNQTAKKWEVHRNTFQKGLLNYELFGEEGLYPRTGNQYYSESLKCQAVELYLSGQASGRRSAKNIEFAHARSWNSGFYGIMVKKNFAPQRAQGEALG